VKVKNQTKLDSLDRKKSEKLYNSDEFGAPE